MASDLKILQQDYSFPIYPGGYVPKSPHNAGEPIAVAKGLPAEFLNRTEERTLALGVRDAAQRTESYIRTTKLRNAIKYQVDSLMEKYNVYITGLLERIDELQHALRASDLKLADANKKLIALFGSDNRDQIVDVQINGLFEHWEGIRGELDGAIAMAAKASENSETDVNNQDGTGASTSDDGGD